MKNIFLTLVNLIVGKEEKKPLDRETGFIYKIGNQEFTVFHTQLGSYYINRVSSKTGKTYKQYLKYEFPNPNDVSDEEMIEMPWDYGKHFN